MVAGTQRRRGTGSLKRVSLFLLVAATVAACAGGSSGGESTAFVPSIYLQPNGSGWSAEPTSSRLKKVSNNGLGYTGQIDRYELTLPAPGRLQVSLSWDHDANFDVILASDDLGKLRLASGIENGNEPEYVGIDVVEDQQIFIFVAGWTGDPGPYLLETILLPPTAPLFAIESGPDLSEEWPSDVPLTFTFTTDLDPDQDVTDRVYLVHAGGVTEGAWCIEGRDLTFHPRLPSKPNDPAALIPGELHVLQFPRAAHGLRAATGEYLSELEGFAFRAAAPVDLWPGAPMITGITPSPSLPYHGEAITIAISEPLDPGTVLPQLVSIAPGGAMTSLPFQFDLTQTYHCSGEVEVRLLIAPTKAPPAGTWTRLTLSPALALGGGPPLNNSAPVAVDFPPP